MNYFVKRILLAIPLVIGITFFSFLIINLAPGSPSDMMLNPQSSMQDLDQLKRNLGLDKPIAIQYFYWLRALLNGNFGYSYVTGQPVLTEILSRLPATLLLSVSSLVLILGLTIPLGIISAAYKNRFTDHIIMVLSFIGMSIPTFWLGIILILFMAVKFKLFPTSGYMDPLLIDASFSQRLPNILYHLALPLTTIMIGGLAGLTRYLRFSMLGTLNKPYVTAARARGLSERSILFKQAFKNAALPIITILGLSLPELVGGSFVIEFIFSWPGMGQLGVNAIFARDYPIIMGTLVLSSVLIVVGNLIADLSYHYIDPRISKK